MPAAGGDSAKLGNRYEGIWAVDVALKILDRRYEWILPEPLDDPEGIEFVAFTTEGRREFHSAKRQFSKGEWTTAELSRSKKNGRSILRDLIRRTREDAANHAVFVSGTTAWNVEQFVDEAMKHRSGAEFDAALTTKQRVDFARLKQNLEEDRDAVFYFLKRLRVVLINETTLRQRVDADIERMLVRTNGQVVDAEEVRLKLADDIVANHRRQLDYAHFVEVLRRSEYEIADWQQPSSISSRLRECSESYRRRIDTDLISKRFIERPHFDTVLGALRNPDGPKFVIVEGSAGTGKSCFISAIAARLMAESVPVLAARVDDATGVSTTQEFGHRILGMRKSPVAILAGIAGGRRCVLVMDQLDAASEFSGRDSRLRDLFDRLREEAENYPQMRVLLGCRTVDLESDHRLKSLTTEKKRHQRVKVERLTEAEVRACLKSSQVADEAFTATMIDVLRTPIHLRLFFETLEGNEPAFRSNIDLFERYWDLSRRQVRDRLQRDPKWDQTIYRLIAELRATRSLTAHEEVFDDDDLIDDARTMASCNVFMNSGKYYRFFHEAFFDYCAARRMSLRRLPQSTLFDSQLADSDQDLSVRSALRQSFQFNRERNFETYLTDLHAILTDSRVRFHLKTMLIQWIGALDSPKPVEWKLLEPLVQDAEFGGRLLVSLRPNLSWFDVLDETGTIARWLTSEIEQENDRAIWLMTEDKALEQRSPRIAELIEQFYGRSDKWNQRVLEVFKWGYAHCSRRMFDLFLRAIDDGLIVAKREDEHGDLWTMLHRADDEAPAFCAEAIGHWIAKVAAEFKPDERRRLFDDNDSNYSGEMLIQKVATDAPRAFYEHVSRWLVPLIEQHAYGQRYNGLRLNRVFWTNNSVFGIAGQLEDGMRRSFEWMAMNAPAMVDAEMSRFAASDIETLVRLAVSVWIASPIKYAATGIEYFLAHPLLLQWGYGSWLGEGTGHAAVARMALQAFTPICDDSQHQRLESAILSLNADDDERWSHLYRYLLLMSLDRQRLSVDSKRAFDALRAQFPEVDTRIPERDNGELHQSRSPITDERASLLSNDEWLAAMSEFNFDEEHEDERRDFIDAIELSRQLQRYARTDRKRFAELALTMPSNLRPHYFDSVLEGLVARWVELSPEERAKDTADIEQQPMELWCEVIERLHGLPGRPCGRSICIAVEVLSGQSVPDRLMEIVSWYAINDPDPRTALPDDRTQSPASDFPAEAVNRGINTIRGKAARAIYRLLDADFNRFGQLRPAIESLVQDQSIAVRSVAISCLFPIMNHERDEALRFFFTLSDEQPATWGTQYWEHFVSYACHSHYTQLRWYLRRAAQSSVKKVAQAAARRMARGALQNLAENDCDIEWLLQQSSATRVGVAKVLAAKVVDADFGEFCRSKLQPLFNDEDTEVRQVAARCFQKMTATQIETHETLVTAFRESAAFDLDHNPLLRALDESTDRLPATTMSVVEKFMARATAETGNPTRKSFIDSSHITNLIFRLYEQARDPEARRKCLDLIDRMMQLGFYDVGSKLNAVDS